MGDSPVTNPPMPRLVVDEVAQLEEPSIAAMRRMLQRADSRLNESGIARIDPYRTVDKNERKLASHTGPVTLNGNATDKVEPKGPGSTAGSDWFHLPQTYLTPELRRDLQLLGMRSAWDPKRHYKKDSRKAVIPEYSQTGTIIEGPTEHFSSRIAKRDRKKTFVDEITADEGSRGRFKKKSIEIQASKTSGRRAFYNLLKQKRSK
ncbi:MAG: hypothetical protein Q9169_007513 [Polycauliona sp. 2 TL-2023]